MYLKLPFSQEGLGAALAAHQGSSHGAEMGYLGFLWRFHVRNEQCLFELEVSRWMEMPAQR